MLKSNKGFTLLEVLLVVALLGIILAITIPNIGKGSEKANTELCTSTRLVIQAAAEQYKAIERELSSLEDKENIVEYLHTVGYLRHKLECPKGGTYTYNGDIVNCNMCKIEP